MWVCMCECVCVDVGVCVYVKKDREKVGEKKSMREGGLNSV